jgi:hypothetical protein
MILEKFLFAGTLLTLGTLAVLLLVNAVIIYKRLRGDNAGADKISQTLQPFVRVLRIGNIQKDIVAENHQ